MKLFTRKLPVLVLTIALAACSSAPPISQTTVSDRDARAWFGQYCSKGLHSLSGELVIKSSTREFQGQFPASIRFEQSGSFVLEVTSLIGGTLMRLSSDGSSMQTEVPSKPRYSRKGITHYLGLDLPILTELLLGDLPCPKEAKQSAVRAEGNRMVMLTPSWRWNFEKAEAAAGGVPVRITLLPIGISDPKLKIELFIDEWDQEHNFAKKVTVKSPEGELHWTWRKRE